MFFTIYTLPVSQELCILGILVCASGKGFFPDFMNWVSKQLSYPYKHSLAEQCSSAPVTVLVSNVVKLLDGSVGV